MKETQPSHCSGLSRIIRDLLLWEDAIVAMTGLASKDKEYRKMIGNRDWMSVEVDFLSRGTWLLRSREWRVTAGSWPSTNTTFFTSLYSKPRWCNHRRAVRERITIGVGIPSAFTYCLRYWTSLYELKWSPFFWQNSWEIFSSPHHLSMNLHLYHLFCQE